MAGKFIHDEYTLTAMKLVREGKSFFITGKAGTGKTRLLGEIVRESRARGKNIAVTAPTGIAAKNAEGQTLHSMFGLKTITFIPGKTRNWYHLDNAKERVIRKLDILIIDEIREDRGGQVIDLQKNQRPVPVISTSCEDVCK